MHPQTNDTKDCQQRPEVRKARTDPPIELSEREELFLDFRLLAPELLENKFVLLSVIKFVTFCYRSPRN